MQKRIIRIMTKSDSRSSCRQLFKNLGILPLQSQYILSLLSFVVRNTDQFTNNLEIHNINTRYNINLHPPTTQPDSFTERGPLLRHKIIQPLTSANQTTSQWYKTIQTCPKKPTAVSLFLLNRGIPRNEMELNDWLPPTENLHTSHYYQHVTQLTDHKGTSNMIISYSVKLLTLSHTSMHYI